MKNINKMRDVFLLCVLLLLASVYLRLHLIMITARNLVVEVASDCGQSGMAESQ